MSTTYTTTQPSVTHRSARTVRLGAALIAIAALGIAAMLALSTTAGRSDRAATAESAGLSPQQIVIRGEVQDRLSAEAKSESVGLSPQQIVIRGEVQDRLGN
jgi:hypothetical protein